eukprot:Lankesteria_metandrocarpae@DN6778_c0_g1_i1.p1
MVKLFNAANTFLQEPVKNFTMNALQTPIVFAPTSDLCFIVREVEREPEILCCPNSMCRDEWWTALTQRVSRKAKGRPYLPIETGPLPTSRTNARRNCRRAFARRRSADGRGKGCQEARRWRGEHTH